eukprot:g18077.t2
MDIDGVNTCSNGLPGYEASSVCCPVSCGRCGGSGCSALGDGCCTSGVKKDGDLCSVTLAAPCNIDGPLGSMDSIDTIDSIDSVDSSDDDVDDVNECSNGLPGYEASGVCCPVSCGRCGGSGCSALGDGCCTSGVKKDGDLCSVTLAAPCNIDGPLDLIDSIDSIDSVHSSDDDAGFSEKIESYKVTGPTEIMTIPTDPSDCDADKIPSFRYSTSSGAVGKGRIYAESPGCFTMTDIYNWRGTVSSGGVLSSKGPIFQLDDDGAVLESVGAIGEPVTNKWLLTAELYVTDGAIFYCKGSKVGGDCDELRIQSIDHTDFYEVRGHGGSLYFEETIVTSWDTPNREPQAVHEWSSEEKGRSFVNCVSEKLTGETCEGRAKKEMGECRMDIIKSEMAYLGYFESESYGITWKVRGFCKDLSNHDVFTTTNVYGDMIDSDIHHNYYGHYSYGHQGGVWTGNKMHDNWQYGFDPHDDSDYLTIADNEVWNNVNHGIIASKRCNNLKIYNNEVYDGGAQAVGIFLHLSADNTEVYGNTIYNMQDAGIAFMETMNGKVYDNDIKNCKQGIRLSMGSAGNHIYDNTFDRSTQVGFTTYRGTPGRDDPTPDIFNIDRDGHPHDNIFKNNRVRRTDKAFQLKNSQDITLIDNNFSGADKVDFNNAQNTRWIDNGFPSSACMDIITSNDGDVVPASTFTDDSDGLPDEC